MTTPQPFDGEIRRVIVDRDGDIGRITLDRFEALNALTHSMVRQIAEALDEFEGQVAAVVIDSSHPKVFCAGGDIREIRRNTLSANPSESHGFFADEYALNERIANASTPIVSLIDGVCMGGGMGLAVHGSARIVTKNAVLAMPETAIGFFPDVGASYFLSRLEGALGRYWGLTGARISAGDAMYSGLATHYFEEITADSLVEILKNRGAQSIAAVLEKNVSPRPESNAEVNRKRIDDAFEAPTLDGVLAVLESDDSSWGSSTRTMMNSASPQSLGITFALLEWAKTQPLRECLDAELALATEIASTADFVEGVRAVLVDKDRNPVWTDSSFRGLGEDGRAEWDSQAFVAALAPG